jgi:hypothetical protein
LIAALAMVSLMVPFSVAGAASPPVPSFGVANVDGDSGEWNLANDFFADLLGQTAHTLNLVTAKLYLRYDCSSSTLYILVLAHDVWVRLPW